MGENIRVSPPDEGNEWHGYWYAEITSHGSLVGEISIHDTSAPDYITEPDHFETYVAQVFGL